jgi:putative DNA primase/helicase
MTKITSVSAKGDCPQWLKFLDDVTDGSREFIEFLQRVSGYALTGMTTEHALFFAHGSGGNGKSVLIDTLSGILGDYAVTASTETFTHTNHVQHPTELARFRGARLVTAIETEEGKRWAEARIKTLTGGDPIAARFMRQDFFQYTPQFKLLIAGNHRPAIRSVDEGIRRRFHLLPFDVTIPRDKRDPNLFQKLKLEWPGILNWMIDGCLEWQNQGLNPPHRIRKATERYFEAEDAVGRFISECCVRTASDKTSSTELWNVWKGWAESAGEYQGTQRRFSQSLIERGFEQGRSATGMFFIGITLR